MPITKNQLIRYKILDKCFRNNYRKYFIVDLIYECTKVLVEINSKNKGISRRQIIEDIAFMESSEGWGIELKRLKDGKRVYYRYEDPNYSINNMPLNELEIDQLESAMQILGNFQGMPQFQWVNEMLPKLRQGIPGNNKKQLISFDSNQYLKGIGNLPILYNAIVSQSVLDVIYQDFKSEAPYHIIIHPYFLKQYNNRWFLLGLNEEKDNTHWNLALDRIQAIELTDKKYRVGNTNWEEYFDDVVGVTVPNDKSEEHIVLHFFGETGKYVYNKPLHGSQKAKWINDHTLEVTLKLKINYELERLIMSYADSIQIIVPQSLKESISSKLKMGIHYNV